MTQTPQPADTTLSAAQAARQEAELARQHMQDLLMQAPAIIGVLHGKNHIFEFANEGYLQMVGQRDLIGKPIREALPDLASPRFFEQLDQVYATGQPYTGQEIKLRIDRHHTGTLEERYFNFVYQPTHTSYGRVDGILIHAVDVTEQVRAREELIRSEERLKISQQIGHVGTFEWDVYSNRLIWTPELEALYGLKPGEAEGDYQLWAKHIHPDDLERVQTQFREAVEQGSAHNIEYRVVWPDGTIHWLVIKAQTNYDEQGRPTSLLGVNIDITERKEAEQQLSTLNQELQELNATLEARVGDRTAVLNQLNTELQRSNQELQDFAYVASHDLQEPLRKIQAFGNLLEEEYGPALGGGRTYLERMRNAASRMRTLIDDLLTFSRVTTKAEPFTRVNLVEVVREVVDDLEPRLKVTNGTITVGELPSIYADARQMYQLFQNLLGNALKFHRRGVAPVVEVSAEILDSPSEEPPSNQQCRIFVADNGIGFDEKYLDRIFTVFQRLHGKGEYEGTGIGLAVVRKIVERHGGSITAHSKPGEGTTFIVTLPVYQQNLKESTL